jgi:spore germination protein
MPIHVVKPNETMDTIARQYGVSMRRLMYDNEVYDPTKLVIGQALLVLLPTKIHVVKENETLYTIARDYQVDVLTLVRNNPFVLQQPTLNAGDTIIIQYEGTKSRAVTTNGYVYPYVRFEVLEQTLPYLTTLCIFSYGFTVGGDLIPIEDEQIIEITRKNGVDPILVLTPLGPDGNFNNNLVSAVAQSVAVQDKLIAQLLQTVKEKGYAGVDVDFEFIQKEDGPGYTNFVRKMREQMNAQGFVVSVALAPKTSADMPGLLYEGMNYAALGAAANKALLMTYEWGYTSGRLNRG